MTSVIDTEAHVQSAIADSAINTASKIAVIEDKVFGENGLIKEVKEVKDKLDRFTFLFVGGCVTVCGSILTAILTHSFH